MSLQDMQKQLQVLSPGGGAHATQGVLMLPASLLEMDLPSPQEMFPEPSLSILTVLGGGGGGGRVLVQGSILVTPAIQLLLLPLLRGEESLWRMLVLGSSGGGWSGVPLIPALDPDLGMGCSRKFQIPPSSGFRLLPLRLFRLWLRPWQTRVGDVTLDLRDVRDTEHELIQVRMAQPEVFLPSCSMGQDGTETVRGMWAERKG